MDFGGLAKIIVYVFGAGTIVTALFAWRMIVLSDRRRAKDRDTELHMRLHQRVQL